MIERQYITKIYFISYKTREWQQQKKNKRIEEQFLFLSKINLQRKLRIEKLYEREVIEASSSWKMYMMTCRTSYTEQISVEDLT